MVPAGNSPYVSATVLRAAGVLADQQSSCFASHVVRRQGALAIPQVGPTLLDLSQLDCVEPLCFCRVSRTQTEALLALAKEAAKIIWNPFPEPIVDAVGMLPGTSHRRSNVHHPCVPSSGGKAYANQWPIDFFKLLCVLADRESDELLSFGVHGRPPSISISLLY